MYEITLKNLNSIKKYLIGLSLLLSAWQTNAQVTLATQTAVNNFNPTTTHISGSLTIGGAFANSDIANLTSLSNIKSIGGDLNITYNKDLSSLNGLENIQSVEGDIFITNNALLSNCLSLFDFIAVREVTIVNNNSGCNSAAEVIADNNKCGNPGNQLDLDKDGVLDCEDSCPNTPDGVSVDAHGCSGTAANAGPDQSQCNDSDFILAGNAPDIGIGRWSVVSGTANITTTASRTSTVTGIVAGSSATLKWTITNGTITSSDEVVLTNDVSVKADAGPDQTQINNPTFILAAKTPSIGTGVWSVISGEVTIADVNSPTSMVTVAEGTTDAVLTWTITNGVCTSGDEVALVSKRDLDGDGIPDDEDDCDDRRDIDGDGTPDCRDNCDNRIDTDGDGIVDCFDLCDDRIDTDGDGTSDCKDNCPNDPTKIEPDACGCGTPPQIDSDGDGIVNCMDDCPYDLNQYIDGQLKCGQTMKSDTRLGDRVIVDYGECTDFDYTGRELFYKLTLYDAGKMTVRFKEIGNGRRELQLMILNDYCYIDSCIGMIPGNPGTEESLVLEDMPAGDYYFAVDSRDFYDRAEFELTVDCGGGGTSMVTCPEDALLTEDFEGYDAGTDIVAASANFEPFGETSTSAKVTTTHDETPNKALYLNRNIGVSDLNFVIGNQQHDGIGRIAFNMYVAPNKGAYFNIFGHESTPSYGVKYQINTDDRAFQGKWMSVEAYFDMDNDKYTLFIDNRRIVVSGNYVLGLGRINFYAYWNNDFYIDNLCYSRVASIPAASRVARVENELLENVVKPTAATMTTATSEYFATKVAPSTTAIKKDLKIFPNPTTGTFHYQGRLSTSETVTVEIFNQLGQSVRRVAIAEASIIDLELELNNFPDGIYFLKAFSDKLLDTQRIVLQR